MIAQHPPEPVPARCGACGWTYYGRGVEGALVLHLPDGRHRVVPPMDGPGPRTAVRQARQEALAMASRLHDLSEDLAALLRYLDTILEPEL